MSTTPSVAVIVASTRQNRVGRSIADAVADLAHTTLAWADRVKGFDGFIVVTPEYNGGYRPR